MLRPEERKYVLEQAYVPEHVLPLMEALSGGEAHLAGEFLFFTGSDWLIMVGFPLGEAPKHELECKLKKAREEFAPARLWLVGPQLPDFLERPCTEVEKDQYFRLDLKTPDGRLWAPPGKLQRLVAKARERFSVDSSGEFHSLHAQLTESLMQRGKPGSRVRELYGRLPWYLEKTPSAVLLSAWDPLGRLAAYAVLELAAAVFSAYVAGACSRESWASHASDLLMWEMALISIRENKQFMHLGLGVNPGISRFKRNWGGRAWMDYRVCGWSRPLSKTRRFLRSFGGWS